MNAKKILRPIFFIGNPRSGTTLIFEIFVKHPDLAWLMNYNDFFPNSTFINYAIPLLNNKFVNMIGQKKQYNSTTFFNKYLPKPDECYRFWEEHTAGVNFSRDFLLNKKAEKESAKKLNKIILNICKYQNKKYFVTKLTGPGRIAYLNSIFPDAIFIHIVRDGRSVVQSLMNVKFWKTKVDEPWFINGLTAEDLNIWKSNDKDPTILTTLLWNRIIETTQYEASQLDNPKERYLEIKYEDFIQNPNKTLEKLFKFSHLTTTEQVLEKCMSGTNILNNMNKKFNSHFSDDKQAKINSILLNNLKQLNYL